MNKLLTSLAVGACITAITGVAQAQIKVGMLVPTSGVYAALGTEIDAGFNIALEESDMQDQFEIVIEDTEAKPSVGVQKARKLILQDQSDVMVGIVSSAVLGAVRDFVDGSQVPLIVANAGNDEATGAQCSPYITRVSFSNAQITRPMGQWMYDQGLRKVYTLAPDYAAGRQMIVAFSDDFVAAGGEIVGAEYTPFQNTQDFAPYLTSATAENPDAVFVFYAGSEAINFVKQYDSLGIKESTPLYGAGFLTSPLYVAAEGPAAEGVIASLNYIPTLDTPENKTFVDAYQAKFDRSPSEYTVQGYDAGRLLVEAVKAGATDKASIAAGLSKIQYTGPRGPLTIDPLTNNIIQNIYIYETVSDGNDGLTQKLLDTVANVQDEPNGCSM